MGRFNFSFLIVILFSVLSLNTFADDTCVTELRPAQPFKNSASELDAKWVQQEISRLEKTATPQQKIIRQAAQDNGIEALSLNREIIQNHNEDYTNLITTSCVTDQHNSGRCWLFASLNMLRPRLYAEKLVDKDFEFSENYLYFFSMLERANVFLKKSEKAVRKSADNRAELIERLEKNDANEYIGDGGYFQWFTFLVDKYGLVPKASMIEASAAVATKVLRDDLDAKLISVTEKMRQRVLSGQKENLEGDLKAIREQGIKDVLLMLVTSLGTPPEKFEFRVVESKKKLEDKSSPLVVRKANVKEYTPQTFAKEFVKFDSREWVTVFYNPRFALNKRFRMKDSNVGIELKPDLLHSYTGVNMSLERMEQLTMASIDAGQPLYFSSDVKNNGDFTDARSTKPYKGILHPDLYNRDAIYGFQNESSLKADRKTLTFYDLISATHAMSFIAYDRPNPNAAPIKFLVENSWGVKSGDVGKLHMYREWFYQNVFALTIRRDLLTPAERAMADEEPIVIKEKEW